MIWSATTIKNRNSTFNFLVLVHRLSNMKLFHLSRLNILKDVIHLCCDKKLFRHRFHLYKDVNLTKCSSKKRIALSQLSPAPRAGAAEAGGEEGQLPPAF